MNQDIEVALRSPSAYALGHEALKLMEEHNVWPTPLNYEIWLYVVGDPNCPLSLEVMRLIQAGETLTEDISEHLASKFIPRLRLSDEVRDAGMRLTRELASITELIVDAQKSQKDYSHTLEGASNDLSSKDPKVLSRLIASLQSATNIVLEQSGQLEARLSDSSREVLRLRKHLEQVRIEAMTDALTNLSNRKSFDERLERLVEDSTSNVPLTLAVVDIDHFKRFNDTWGHQTGDQVLRYVASVLSRVGREPRLAARYGGEEFGMIFPGESIQSVTEIMNQVRIEIASRLLKRRSTNEDLGTVTISVGIAEHLSGEDAYALLDRADSALYSSKNNGRNQVTCAPKAADAVNAA